ncbi:MAG: chorismate synthase [Nitrospira bacterium SG8_35_4]|nr:MAG: chorismate synthase [Nitrospira bacterium SG8_35_4]
MLENLRYLTSGESHGRALVCTVDGVPSGLALSADDINRDLARRQKGYGRGGRMKIESDQVQILSGVRRGRTLGSPISFLIENKDWNNWAEIMNPEAGVKSQGSSVKGMELNNSKLNPVTRPRPGHADLSGALKYDHKDLRNVLERSSARETAARVAIGAVAKRILSEFDIQVLSYVTEIGGIGKQGTEVSGQGDEKKLTALFRKAEKSPVRCPDKKLEQEMIARIDHAMKRGDSLGGVFEVAVCGVPAGLGSYSQWDRRLNARLVYSMMGTQAIKGVEIGLGFEMARRSGSEVMDEIFYSGQKKNRKSELAGGFFRKTNNAGGIEGGVSSGMPIIIRAAMKPIPTLRSPLFSVDITTKKKFRAAYERSDVCAVPAAAVVGEAVTAIVIADSFIDKFGGDSMKEMRRNFNGYIQQLNNF